MEKSKARELEQQKKAPGKAEQKKSPNKKSQKEEYAIFGEGDLTFSFTDWLTGTAHVIIDSRGHLTIIGKITPQKK